MPVSQHITGLMYLRYSRDATTRACIAVSLVVGFCFLLFVLKKKVLEYGIVGLILVLLEQQAFQLFFPSIYGCSCDVQSFIHSL